MELCIGRHSKSLLLISESESDVKKINEIMNQATDEEVKRFRSLHPVIPGRLYYSPSAEETGF